MHLHNNQALYHYLLQLAQGLESRGHDALGRLVAGASGQAAASSAEFLGESRITLRRLLQEEKGALTQAERAQMEDILGQITAAINRWPQREQA